MKTETSPRLKRDKPPLSGSATRKFNSSGPHRSSPRGSLSGVSEYVYQHMRGDDLVLLPRGDLESLLEARPGATTSGVDIVQAGAIVDSCSDERGLLELVKGSRCRIIKSVRPDSRRLFGRGDECVTPTVLKEIDTEDIVLVSTPESLASLNGSPLIVDTGDPDLDERLSGFYSVSTGQGRRAIYKVVPWAKDSGVSGD